MAFILPSVRPSTRHRAGGAPAVAAILAWLACAAPIASPSESPAAATQREMAARRELIATGLPLDAAGTTLQVGSLSVHLGEGTLVPVTDGGGGALGVAFAGHGTYELSISDETLLPVTRHNLQALGSTQRVVGTVIRRAIDAALILGPVAEPVPLRAPPNPQGGPRRELRRIPGLLRAYETVDLPRIDHLLAAAGPQGAGTAHVLLRSGPEAMLYARDAAAGGRETLYVLPRRGPVRHPSAAVSFRTGPEADEAPFVVTAHELQVEHHGGLTLQIRGSLELQLADPPPPVLRFRLMNHQDGPEVPWDRGHRRLRVVGLAAADQRPLTYSHRYHELLVFPHAPLRPGTPFMLSYELEADIAVRPGGDRYFVLRTLPWYPRPLDDAEAYRMHWTVRTAPPFRPLISGETRVSGYVAGRFLREASTTFRVRFGSVVAGDFVCEEYTTRPPAVRVCTYSAPRPRVSADVAAYFSALIEVLERTLVPFPFRELTVVEIPAYDLAQATPGMILLSREILSPRADPVSRLLGADAAKRMAHELAHTWWGQIVKYRHPEDLWLSESFAEYFGGLALAAVAEDDLLEGLRGRWRNAALRSAQVATLRSAYLLSGEGAFIHWRGLLYGKGPLAVEALRHRLGDERFFRALQRFLREAGGGRVGTEDLVEAVRLETRVDVAPLLAEWLDRTGLPRPPEEEGSGLAAPGSAPR